MGKRTGFALASWLAIAAGAQADPTVADIVQRIADRPALAHGRLGVEIVALDTGAPLYARDGDKFFTPGSTTKLVTEGAALALLGPDFRFHTRVYRTGPVKAGVLEGDIVVVGSGDPNLSGRVRPDGTLGFVDEDHNYGGKPLDGDPVAPLTRLAHDIAAMGIHAVTGTVLIDIGLFGEGDREIGSGMVISPIEVNDNAVDVIVTPGSPGAAPSLRIAPESAHIRFVNTVVTGIAGGNSAISRDVAVLPDGTRVVTLRGSVSAGHAPINSPYAVDEPSRFASDILIAQLAKAGVTVAHASPVSPLAGAAQRDAYRPATLLADIVSPPLSEDARITLKVSQNLHAATMPYVIGSMLGKTSVDANLRGLGMVRDWLVKAGLDLGGAAQRDGEGGADFTPDFMVHYLAYIARQPYFPAFLAGLPILGHDGTLADVGRNSKAAGQVFAKTGTYIDDDPLNGGIFVAGKGLAGYTKAPSGERLAFAIYLNNIPIRPLGGVAAGDRLNPMVADPIGEIAAAANLFPIGDAGGAGRQR